MSNINQTWNDILYETTRNLSKYRPGDLLQALDLSQNLDSFIDSALKIEPRLTKLFQHLKQCTEEEIKGQAPETFVQTLSDGLDLANRILSLELEEAKKEALDQTADFLNSFAFKKEVAETETQAKTEAIDPFAQTEVLALFLSEAKERLARAQELLLAMEAQGSLQESVHELFRIFHTLKGESGFLKLADLRDLTHHLETALDRMRQGILELNESGFDLFLKAVDEAKHFLTTLETSGSKPAENTKLKQLGEQIESFAFAEYPSLGSILEEQGLLQADQIHEILRIQQEGSYAEKFGELAVRLGFISQDQLHKALARNKQQKPKIPAGETESAAKNDEAPRLQASKRSSSEAFIKVKSSKVDYLIDMLGELLISLGQVEEDSPAMHKVRKVVRTLQNAALDMRTESLQNLFGTVRRVVRDTSKIKEKDVELKTLGEDLEIDRMLLERLDEPLLHLVRNSIDHGLESTEDRLKAGKPALGRVSLKAERKGNSFRLSLEDDGVGLNTEAILNKALSLGLTDQEKAKTLKPEQIHEFIFAPGFSTKEKADMLSGRGVGMDIVHSMIKDNRGTIHIDTQRGKFTRFTLALPLNTAIIDGMVLGIQDHQYILPINSIIEIFRFKKDQEGSFGGRFGFYKLRDQVLPLLNLNYCLNLNPDPLALTGIVVEASDGRRSILTVREILGKREIVLKSLGPRFKHLRGVSSVTVLPGGLVGLVLDVDQLISLSLEESDERSTDYGVIPSKNP